MAGTKVLHIRLYAHSNDRSHNGVLGDCVRCGRHGIFRAAQGDRSRCVANW